MKIGVLTSTRADFGIYIPLLKELKTDSFFQLELIAFGTHLSNNFGYTLNEIRDAGFDVPYTLDTMPKDDSPKAISQAMGNTMQIFAEFWATHAFDLVFCLGDRYEMLAAVTAGSPFRVKFAHIHAGETTLGAIDNAYRHSITLMSAMAFVTTEEYKKRAASIIENKHKIYNVGALSIDNLVKQEFFSKEQIIEKFGIDLNNSTILSTFHPETVNYERNEHYIAELIMAYEELSKDYQILITMPNADTTGLMVRKKLEKFGRSNSNVLLRESLGMKGYLTCMKYCAFLLGNTSSGYVEAAFFPKWVINIGERQKGRLVKPNIVTTEIKKNKILNAVNQIKNRSLPKECNIYGDGHAAKKIISILKQ